MSRPFRTRFALCLVAFSVGLSGCDTIYRPVYTNQKNYFQPPEALEAKRQPALTADEVLKSLPDNGASTPIAPLDAGGMPPAAPPAAPDAAPAVPPATPPPP
jgi:hypothetical protein